MTIGRSRDIGWTASETALTVHVGDDIQLAIPHVSGGIGDGWTLAPAPHAGVLKPLGQSSAADDPGTVGGYGTLTFELQAAGAGTAEVRLQCAYRGTVPSGATGAPVTVDVTVQ